jgi:hypothetical protein
MFAQPPGTTYRTLAPRTLAQTRAPTLLPDIAEHSPNSGEETRTPPPGRALRAVSVASFVSDGTIEIEGFGFDTVSEFGDDSSVWGGESLYEGSVYDGQKGSGEVDISLLAEKVLASAKRRLCLC